MNIEQRLKTERSFRYMIDMRPALNKQALFSDTTPDFVSPAEPVLKDKVTVRFRTAKNNVDMVNLVSGDKVLTMSKVETDSTFDYYACTFVITEDIFSYYFQIKVGKIVCYYNARGVSKDVQDYYNFRILPGFRTPNWAKGAVMYQIYVDRFYNGDPDNDVLTNEYVYLSDYSVQVKDWDKYPATMGVREFYGGDLQGVLDKMDYLEDLGVDVIYFNPLFVSPSNHKYDIQDYDYIDPHIGKIVEESGELLKDGQKENKDASKYINRIANKKNLEASNRLFAKVVSEAHKRGMKVILDGVFNHCGSFNKWLDRERIYENAEGYAPGAYISKESPYKDYFDFHQEEAWPYNASYDGWWGHDTLPKLNYENSRELTDYILKIGKKWVSAPYNADGWRLDVAADLGHSSEFNHRFWKEFRKAVKSANPNALIIAEHYGNCRDWISGGEWDSVMNYDAFMEPVTWFLTGMQKHSDDYREDLLGNAESFWGAMSHHGTNFNYSSLQVSMNELSNHDHSRFLTRTNHKVGRVHTLGAEAANEGVNKAVLREAVVIQMTWPGAPTIYYGDEAGVCGFTDPDNRRTYPWGKEDKELIDFHKQIIRIHKLYTPLLSGSLINLGMDYNFIAYGRFDREEQIVVLVNNNNREIEKEIEVWQANVPINSKLQRIFQSNETGYTLEEETVTTVNGKAKFLLPPVSATIYKVMTGTITELRQDIKPEVSEFTVMEKAEKTQTEQVKNEPVREENKPSKDNSDNENTKKAPVKNDKPDEKNAQTAKTEKSVVKNEPAESLDKPSEKSKSSSETEKSKASKNADKPSDKNETSVGADKSSNKGEHPADSNKIVNTADSEKSSAKSEAFADKKEKSSDNGDSTAKDVKEVNKGEASVKNVKSVDGNEVSVKNEKPADKTEKPSDKGETSAKAEKAPDKSDSDAKPKEEKPKTDAEEAPKKSAWDIAAERWGTPEDNKKGWFPFFK